jgi:type II secretory pathway component PulF
MEPITVMVVAGIVGTIVISLYLPMFDLIKAFKK